MIINLINKKNLNYLNILKSSLKLGIINTISTISFDKPVYLKNSLN